MNQMHVIELLCMENIVIIRIHNFLLNVSRRQIEDMITVS